MKKITPLAILLLICEFTFSQAGHPDSSFGVNGLSISDYSKKQGDRFSAVLQQSDGKIVGVGVQNSSYLSVARYNTDGTLDKSFGINGFAQTNMVKDFSFARTGLIQPDDKIIAVAQGSGGLNLVRYNADGTIDNSFGKNGLVKNSSVYLPGAATLQPDNKILVFSDDSAARFNTNGSLDKTFGKKGIAAAAKTGPNYENEVDAASVAPDGKIVTVGAGKYKAQINQYDVVVKRFNSDGSMDNTFGTNGVIVRGFKPNSDYPAGLYIFPDNKILFGAGSDNYADHDYYIGAAKYNEDGSLDESFGNRQGVQRINLSKFTPRVNDMTVQPDGKIVLAATIINNQSLSAALIRMQPNGGRDSSFGNNGIAILPDKGFSDVSDVTLQTDGKILIAGSISKPGGDDRFLIARYLSGNEEQTKPGKLIVVKNPLMASIYPNPVSSNLFVKGLNAAKPAVITVTDMSGNTMLQSNLAAGQAAVNLNRLKQGRYVAVITQDNKTSSLKFIKQ